MKVKTLIFGGAITIVAAGGIAAAVQFSDIKQQNTPFLKVITRETYNQMKAQQGVNNQNVSTKPVAIDYGALPTSGVTFMDALSQDKIKGNAFMITVGSEAYGTTKNILYGQTNDKDGDPAHFSNKIDAGALMLRLYDLFYNPENDRHDLISTYADSMNFYSFIDIVYTKKTWDATNLLQYRRTQMGNEMPIPEGYTENSSGDKFVEEQKSLINRGYSMLWKVAKEKESGFNRYPVVKSSSGSSESIPFDYTPSNSYYEFRPDGGKDTPYEKVYFRDQAEVNLYNDTLDWASSYAGTYIPSASFSKEGSLICAKKENNVWSFKTFTPSNADSTDSTIESIIDFYSIKKDEENKDDGSAPPADSSTPPADAPAAYKRTAKSKVATMPIINEKKAR